MKTHPASLVGVGPENKAALRAGRGLRVGNHLLTAAHAEFSDSLLANERGLKRLQHFFRRLDGGHNS
jgi:hypothetical protein